MRRRPPAAPDLSIGRLNQSDFDKIALEVSRSISAAQLRVTEAEAKREETSVSEARSASRPPSTNRGVKSEIAARLVLEDGQVMEIPARKTFGGENAFIDWLNFTSDERDFFFGAYPVTENEVVSMISYRCLQIFGFGITQTCPSGKNFYHRSYVLGDGCGFICHGGQRDTVLVVLSGAGCEAAQDGWELRLHDFLNACGPRAKITRIDLAHDIYDGAAYGVDRADKDFDVGLYNCGGRNPNIEHRGNWRKPTGKGRTIYFGNRESGKFCRIYEKGRQLGDKSSEWVRVEVEMKAVNRIIPFRVLLHPGEYLAASYPALGWINVRQERILTTQKKTEITYESMKAWAKRQLGAVVNVLVEIEGNAEKAVAAIIKEGAIPGRLKLPSWRDGGEFFHNQKCESLPMDAAFDVCLR